MKNLFISIFTCLAIIQNVDAQPTTNGWGLVTNGLQMSITLNDNSCQFYPDDITDLPKLIDRLRGRSDPVSKFLWDRFPKEDQLQLASYLGSESNSVECRRILVQTFNKIVNGPSIYGEPFFGIALGRDAFNGTLNPAAGGGPEPYHNRLLLRDAFPTELSRTIIHAVTTHKVNELVVLTITLTNIGGAGTFYVPTRSYLDHSFYYIVTTGSGKRLTPYGQMDMFGGSASNLRLDPLRSLQFPCDLSSLYRFDEPGIYTITVRRGIEWVVDGKLQQFHVVSNPLSITILPNEQKDGTGHP